MSASSATLRLLVVGHQSGLRQLLRRWLEGMDSVVCECVSASEALELGASLHPDWVLVDAQLKPPNGLSALRQLTARFARARFVFISDFDDTTLRAAARQAGAGHFLLKEQLSELPALLAGPAAS